MRNKPFPPLFRILAPAPFGAVFSGSRIHFRFAIRAIFFLFSVAAFQTVQAAGESVGAAVESPAAATTPPHIERNEIASPGFGTPKPLLVYLPPNYDPHPEEPYPVIYFLHGFGNTADDFEKRGAAALTDRLIQEGAVPPVVIALPYGAMSYYVNRVSGGAPYEDLVHLDVPAYVEAHYPVRHDPAGKALAGISMGGYGALKIALRYPEEFGSVSAHTPFLMEKAPVGEGVGRDQRMFMRIMHTLYGEPIDETMWEANNPFYLAAKLGAVRPRIMFTAASKDRYGLNAPAAEFDRRLTELGVEHTFIAFDGVHGWGSLADYWETLLKFHIEVMENADAASRP